MAADGVIPQLEPLAGDFNELASAVGTKPADVIKAAGKRLVMEIEAATDHLVWHQTQFVVIHDLSVLVVVFLFLSSGNATFLLAIITLLGWIA